MNAPMERRRAYITLSALVFLLVALFQVYRAATGLPVQIGSLSIPVGASWGVALFAAVMSAWGWRSR
jgi:hypothetical protein